MTWFATLSELECIPLMKEENYETICGCKNSNHAILAENIIRQMFPSQFENDIMGISK